MSVISGRSETVEQEREGLTLSDHVPAGATDQEVSVKIPQSATVERLSVRIYTGAELDLELYPYIQREDGTRQPLLELVGKEYIDGDDDLYEWTLSRPIESGDEITISATNNDGSNAYDYRANLDLEYAGGLSRIFGGVL